MTKEQEDYIGELIEKHIGGSDAIAKKIWQRWPEEKIKLTDVWQARRKYLIYRLGTNTYAHRRLTAYQIFDRGGSVDDVVRMMGTTLKKATEYLCDWRMQRDEWKSSEKIPEAFRKADRIHAPGGAVFGKGTSHDSIWRA